MKQSVLVGYTTGEEEQPPSIHWPYFSVPTAHSGVAGLGAAGVVGARFFPEHIDDKYPAALQD